MSQFENAIIVAAETSTDKTTMQSALDYSSAGSFACGLGAVALFCNSVVKSSAFRLEFPSLLAPNPIKL